MDIRADLSERAVVLPDQWQWVDSPQDGVTRVMLDRVGDEVAVATSFVRYAENSRFPGHSHALGEEFIVLEGEFGDEHGRYPPGTYVRNPAGTQHVPFSEPGCLIWVKLRQFSLEDQTQMVTRLDSEIPASGFARREVYRFGEEQVEEFVVGEGTEIEIPPLDLAQELLVLEGEVCVEQEVLSVLSWLRVPAGSGVQVKAQSPARLFWKTRPEY
jgi:hypothetical protein